MENGEKEIRELRRLLRDLVALATTPAGWVGRDREQIVESAADVLLHTLRADAVYVCLQSPRTIEVVRSPLHPGFRDEVRRLWPHSVTASLHIDTITGSTWPSALRVAMQPIGISGEDGFIVVGCANSGFPNEGEALLLSVAANQAAVALQAALLRTEAELVERKLRAAAESERSRLHDLFMQAPAAIGFLSGPEHRFTFVNLDYVKLTGRKRAEDFVGKTVREAFPELEGQGLFELLDGVYKTGIPYIGTARKVILNRGADGQAEDTYFDFIYQPMRDAAGQVEGILSHGNDVTQQVLARQEIEKREQQFRTLAESIPQLVWMAESDGYIFWYNQRWYEYTGTTPEQMEGWGWQTVHDPDVLPKVLERWKHSIAKGEPFEMVFPLRGADGVFRDFLTRVHPVKDENGAVTRWFGTNTDVTAQRKAELAVRESERRFREMIDALPAAIYTTDAQGRLTHFNPAAVEFSGRTPELGTDQWCVSWKLYYPDGRPMPHDECPMAIALKEGRIIQGAEAIAERPDGTRRWFIPYPTPLKDSQGRIIGGINMLLDITERKQAEEATAHLAAIVASSDDAIISKNLDGIIQSWNKSAEHMFGYTAEEAVGKHITLIVPKDRWDEEKNILARLRRGDRIVHFQTVRRRKDGSTFDLSLSISPVKDSAGRVIGASNVARDITHLKQIERALRESEERFRAMVETTPECVKVVAPDGTLQHMNSAGLAMVGAKLAETVVGKSIYDLIAPEDREKFRAFNERICRGDRDSLEFDMIGLDGNRHHMETHAAPFHNPDGRIVQLAITHDVTERKRAELELRESEQRYRAVTDASPIMVWMSGTDKLCYYFNKGWLDFVGRTLEQEAGNGWAENVHPEDFDRCLQIYVKNFDARQPFEMEYRLRHHTGQYRWITDHGTPRYATDGTFEGYVGGCLDIHDQKEAAEKARSADVSLQLMKIQDEERRHIARELHDSAGQSLTVLGMGLAQLAQKTGRRAPEIATDVENIQETVQQLHREIRTASYLLHPPLLDENGLSSAINWYLDGLRERSDLGIRLEITDDFGRLPRDMELVIFRLVQECLTNVHRHSHSKRASIRMARESTQITLDIRDEGKGISPERLAEIRSGRSGVGIRGMQERLRQFEGTMNIESGSSGTHIFVTIPIPKTKPSEEQTKTEPLQTAV
jgi:PAS domain S-box-containing protein